MLGRKIFPSILDDNLSYFFGDTDYDGSAFNLAKNNKDMTCNNFGKSLLNLCCLYDIHILNGRFPGTYWGSLRALLMTG